MRDVGRCSGTNGDRVGAARAVVVGDGQDNDAWSPGPGLRDDLDGPVGVRRRLREHTIGITLPHRTEGMGRLVSITRETVEQEVFLGPKRLPDSAHDSTGRGTVGRCLSRRGCDGHDVQSGSRRPSLGPAGFISASPSSMIMAQDVLPNPAGVASGQTISLLSHHEAMRASVRSSGSLTLLWRSPLPT